MKQQLNAPPSIPPQKPETLLRNVLWLEGMDEEAKDSIASVAQMRVFDFGETITRQGDEVDGIYLIVSGMVKVRFFPPRGVNFFIFCLLSISRINTFCVPTSITLTKYILCTYINDT